VSNLLKREAWWNCHGKSDYFLEAGIDIDHTIVIKKELEAAKQVQQSL
jgi:hypothetical protein